MSKDKKTSQNMSKNARNQTGLNKILALIPDEKKPVAERLIREIRYMDQQLRKLKKDVKDNGVVEIFKQGAQELRRENPAFKSYNTTIKTYNNTIDKLAGLLPKDLPPEEDDFDKFRKKK